jgi:hypothetical protein
LALSLQPALDQGKCLQIIGVFLGRRFVLIPEKSESGADDLLLLPTERLLSLIATPTIYFLMVRRYKAD